MRIKTETSVGLFILGAIVIFMYMTFQIGVLRFDTARYNKYTVYFHDISGLSKKADVQIAGVKVGWVENVELVNNGQQVRADIMLIKTYTLYSDAYGIIRQDGLLGTKFLEVIPGDPLLPTVKSGGILMKPSKDPVSVDELLFEFQEIAKNLNTVSESFKNVVGGDIGAQRLENAINGFNQATQNISSFADTVDRVMDRNEQAINNIVADLQSFSSDLKRDFPELSHDLRDGVDRVATQVSNAAEPIGRVAEKINNGEGVLGQLVSDKDTARDVKKTIEGIRDYFDKVSRLTVIIDTHGETMYGLGNGNDFEDAKGYFNARIHPTEDYFYYVGIMSSYYGQVKSYERHNKFYDENLCELKVENLGDPDSGIDLESNAPIVRTTVREFDQMLYNLQIGKVYGDIAFRTGLFESTFGVGVDFDIPFNSDVFRWVTSIEAYDFYGRNRINDTRAHLKWINKIFFTNSIYFVCGADDFISKTNKNAFFGAGLRFADDDLKYYVSKISS